MSGYDHPDMTHRPLFQVTLASGRVVTRQEEFAYGAEGDVAVLSRCSQKTGAC
jgi:hypothetical protein